MVTNEKNLIRLFDVAYDGYNGGKDHTVVDWMSESGYRSYRRLQSETNNTTMPYTGPSIMVMAFPVNRGDRLWEQSWPSPIVFHEQEPGRVLSNQPHYYIDPDNVELVFEVCLPLESVCLHSRCLTHTHTGKDEGLLPDL